MAKYFRIVFSLFVLAVLIFSGFYFGLFQRQRGELKPVYSQVYRLVREKVSQSAAIAINLPDKTGADWAKNNLKFEPEIKGGWIPVSGAKEVVFKPAEKLILNRYYSISLALADGSNLTEDFLAVEDPEITAIFPKEDSEAPETSSITIVFNRPMVPLTTLGYLEGKDAPVEIIPSTAGKFKWISTNNLQFIPKERLQRSSRYVVKIKAGLSSMEGLELKTKETKFITRQLRRLDQDALNFSPNFNKPFLVPFNQPVDLEKTRKEMRLVDNTTGKEVSFIVEYAQKSSQNNGANNSQLGRVNNFFASMAYQVGLNWPFSKPQVSGDADQSVIAVFNKADRFGRGKMWNFDTSYTLTINKTYPAEGDIVLDSFFSVGFNVSNPIKNISAESGRTYYAGPNLFDPAGKLWIDFYEDINLGASKISAPRIKEIGYGEKCLDPNLQISPYTSCVRTQDKARIFLIFQQEGINPGEIFDLRFEKIVNQDGLTVNRETIVRPVAVYPEFKIIKTFPANGANAASLSRLAICSNSPIASPAKEDFKKYFEANLAHEINYWSGSYLVSYKYSNDSCETGEFQTEIGYGLMPQSNYSLNLNLEDVFGQKRNLALQFATGAMPDQNLAFFQLQQNYNVTTPDKTQLTYAAENMEYVDMEICQLGPADFLYALDNRPDFPTAASSISGCKKIVRDRIELPKKFWVKNYFKIDLKDYFAGQFGNYVLTFSNPDYKTSYRDWRTGQQIVYQNHPRTYLTVTNLSVAEKKISPQTANYGERAQLTSAEISSLKNLYWVTNISTLNAVEGAVVNGQFLTNDQGIALVSASYSTSGVTIVKGDDSTVIPAYQSRVNYGDLAYSARKVYLYTDKPIYRPTQEVFIKGLYRLGYDGDYQIYQGQKINLKVFNSKQAEIFSQELTVNDFGSFNTKIVIDRNAPLGTYRACVKDFSCGYFEVLEYVPAAFKVEVKSDKEEYISKDVVNLDIDSQYYFGVPLDGGEVDYAISSQNYYFDRYADGYFNFGKQGDYFSSRYYGEKFILRGKTQLDSRGKAKISQALDLAQMFSNPDERQSKIIVFDVTVKNPQGQSVSSQKSFILHMGEFYLGLSADKSFFPKNEKTNLKVKSVDTEGKAARETGLTLNLYKVEWNYIKRQGPGGGYDYVWEKKKDLVKDYRFDTDNNGNHVQEIQIDKEGEYEVRVWGEDRRNNLISSNYSLYVFGSGEVSMRPTTDTSLDIKADKTSLNVNDLGSVAIQSPAPRSKALISLERGKVLSYEIKEIQGNLFNYTFLAKEEYAPNIYLSVLLVSQKPEVKFGNINFTIDTSRKNLDIEVKFNKETYLPGQEVVLDIFTKDYQGQSVSSEVSVAVVDLSVLALKGNPKKNPLIFFYGGFPLAVSTASNIKNLLIEIAVPIGEKGGGGVSEEALATKKRGVFKETAYWQADVRTNEQGRAQVKFILPDNLTTWQAETIGLTKDTKLGADYLEFQTKKELMVVPLKPRFVVPGDAFSVGAQIFNQSSENLKLTLKFESSGLVLRQDKAEKDIKVDKGKTATVYFKVQAPSSVKKGNHVFSLSAKGGGLQDTVEQSISITANNTYEVTAASNYTTAPLVKEYVFLPSNTIADQGDLKITSSATLAVFLSDALNYLLGYPYGCSEQISSRLNAIAIIKRSINLPNLADKFKLEKVSYQGREYTIDEAVEISLAQLYNNQQADGGFSYWPGGSSNFHLTLAVAETLRNLSLSGFPVNSNSSDKASSFIYRQITNSEDLYSDNNAVILAAYVLSRNPQYAGNQILQEKIINITLNDLFIQDQISNQALAYLAIILNKGYSGSLKERISKVLDNRLLIDSRGAFLEANKNLLWQYYETPVKNTALYLKFLAETRSNNPISDKVVRWLLNSKQKDGAWGSTNNTLAVVEAFGDFLSWKRETESNFTLNFLLNGQNAGSFNFNSQTILDQFREEISLKDLKINENNVISFKKENHNELANTFYYDLSLKYYLPADAIAPRDEGFTITKELYGLDDKKNENPLKSAKVGEVLKGHLEITVPKSRNFVAIEDYIPAGMEIIDLNLATEQKSLLREDLAKDEDYYRSHSPALFPDFKEIRDDRNFLFREFLAPGVYEFDYYVRALVPGKFIQLPSQVFEMYTPENFGRTDGRYFEIK